MKEKTIRLFPLAFCALINYHAILHTIMFKTLSNPVHRHLENTK